MRAVRNLNLQYVYVYATIEDRGKGRAAVNSIPLPDRTRFENGHFKVLRETKSESSDPKSGLRTVSVKKVSFLD